MPDELVPVVLPLVAEPVVPPLALVPVAPLPMSEVVPVALPLVDAGAEEVVPAAPEVPELVLVSSCMRDELQAASAIARMLPSTTPWYLRFMIRSCL
jgi:hypothetical protein